MPDKIMSILAAVTGGKSYKAHKYGLDHADRPFIDYYECTNPEILEILSYYRITRDIAEGNN